VGTERAGLAGRGFFFGGGQTFVTNAADFGARNTDLNVAIARDLFFELLVEPGLEFADFATAETGNMDVIARAMGLIVVAITTEMEEVELVDQALAF